MHRSTSLYLDLLRFAAAVCVVVSHLSWGPFGGRWLWRLQPIGFDAVLVFFVLSGFVVAYAAETKDASVTDYALSRLSRLYSVVLPALILTVVLATVGSTLNPELHPLTV